MSAQSNGQSSKRQRSESSALDDYESQLSEAEQLVPIIGSLYRNRSVPLTLFKKLLCNASPAEILATHRRVARDVSQLDLSVLRTGPLIRALAASSVQNCHVDVGRLLAKMSGSQPLAAQLESLLGGKAVHELPPAQDVVLYGFGRIGRLLARIILEKKGLSSLTLRLRAIVLRPSGVSDDVEKRAALLQRDSVHGVFPGLVTFDEEKKTFQVNGNVIQLIHASSPEEIDYTAYGIDDAILIDNSGKWRDRKTLSKHTACKGIARVILTAPASGDVKNLVVGVNDSAVSLDSPEDRIVAAASCTTNAVCPVLKAMNDRFGVLHAHMETVHSFTNDQNLVDNYHKKSRRGRAAPLNLVITETGAAEAVSEVLPELEGKLTGNAIRVPTPNVSLAILVLTLRNQTSVDVVNAFLRDIAVNSPLSSQVDFSASSELVSSDVTGNRSASVVDSKATIVQGDRVNLYIWYDNEFGYSCQVVRLAQIISRGGLLPSLP
jgi:glyceraldehyde 3-phosphate dehydrogenase